ncbi:hypothetical protein HYFRA_00001621 [Hymenoscyphus fraxineus]|uniref:Uncharacterized protein n=1 Tax=Hymenoscyphus fraxineus TaxID=746836 RepID=A0A9N9L8L8_9HELO|nr:hypothetical protein HYFRA_00001621 [Hymenoscyphus fraxineus]
MKDQLRGRPDEENSNEAKHGFTISSITPYSATISYSIQPGETTSTRASSRPIEPSNRPKRTKPRRHTVGARIQALYMLEYGGKEAIPEIEAETKVKERSVYWLRERAISRGWKPGGTIEPFHVEDVPKSGRSRNSRATVENTQDTIQDSAT